MNQTSRIHRLSLARPVHKVSLGVTLELLRKTSSGDHSTSLADQLFQIPHATNFVCTSCHARTSYTTMTRQYQTLFLHRILHLSSRQATPKTPQKGRRWWARGAPRQPGRHKASRETQRHTKVRTRKEDEKKAVSHIPIRTYIYPYQHGVVIKIDYMLTTIREKDAANREVQLRQLVPMSYQTKIARMWK
jgi:hypothetical protein